MTDLLDRKIKGFVAELVDAAPVPPTLGPYASPSPRRPRRRVAALAAAVSCLAAAGAVAVVADHGEESRVRLGGGRSPATPVVEEYEKPTFVVPSRLPAGFTLVGAGSDTFRRMGAQEIVFWSEDFVRSGRVVWGGPEGRCPPGREPRWVATSQRQAIDRYRSATASTGFWPEQLQWCEAADHVLVTVSPGRGMSREDTARIAEGVVRDGDDLAVRLPAGFTAVRTHEDRDLIRLLYESPNGDDLWVDVWGVGVFALERHRLDSENPASWEAVTVGGRPALKGDHFVSVLYDEHTLVDISSVALPESELLAVAASLVPGDPSVPRPMASDRTLCKRLELC